MNIKEGECILFCGESGSGKTTLINSINGIAINYNNCSYSGDIIVDGVNIKDLELYEISKIISSVFQNPKTHFFNVDTTIELLFYLENNGYSKEDMVSRLNEMLSLFPIKNLLNRNIFHLSGGEKQILSIAASYIAGTKIIVLDEPSSNLDYVYTKIVKDMLEKLKNKGITILIAEHRLYYLTNLIDKVYYIKNGKVFEEFSKEDFLNLNSNELKKRGLRGLYKEELNNLTINSINNNFCIKELIYKFPETSKKLNLKDLNLDTGKIYGIIGKNGAGKSTFIKSLIGVNKKSKDNIFINNRRNNKRNRIKKSNLVMQDVNHQLFTDSIYNEVVLGIDYKDDKLIKDILSKLNLWKIKDKHPMSLSGGQKQRVAIASVILSNSKIICFDEPTSGMDYINMVKISNLIKFCSNKENIIFIVSHDIEFLNQTVDYCIKII